MDNIQLAGFFVLVGQQRNARNFILSCCLFKEVYQTVSQENRAQSRNSRRKKFLYGVVAKATGIQGQNSERERYRRTPKTKTLDKLTLAAGSTSNTSHTSSTSLEGIAQKSAEWLKTAMSQSVEEMLKFQLKVESFVDTTGFHIRLRRPYPTQRGNSFKISTLEK